MPLPDPDPVLRTISGGRSIYNDIVADSRVAALIDSRRGGLLARTITTEAGEASPAVIAAVEDMIANLDIHAIIDELWNGILFGFLPVEVIWDQSGSLLSPLRIEGRNPAYFYFDYSGNLIYRPFYGNAEINCSEDINALRIFTARRRATATNPYGEALASRLFWPVSFKRGGIEFWLEFAEKYGSPFTIGKYRQGADKAEQNAIVEALDTLRRGAVGAFPEGTDIEIKEAGGKGSSADLYEKLVRWCTEEIAIAILGHNGTSQSTAGKLGSEDAALEVRQDLIDADARVIAQTINDIIRVFVNLNFGNVPAPKILFSEEQGMGDRQAKRDVDLYSIGVRFKPSYIARSYNIPEGEFTLESPSPVRAPLAGAPSSFAQFASPSLFPQVETHSSTSPQGGIASLTDQTIAATQSPWDSLMEQVETIVNSATSLESLQTDLLNAYGNLETAHLAGIMEQAFSLAELQGMASCQK